MSIIVLLIALVGLVSAQHAGSAMAETHLAMPVQHCTKSGGCQFENTSSVLDSNWRWTHAVGCTNSSSCNCFLGNGWVNETCSTVEECTQKCAIDGEDEKGYLEKYGIYADGSGMLNLTFVMHYKTGNGTAAVNGTNVGSRMYLLEDDHTYKMFNLLNREFTFTIDTSNLPCGLNGALYFVEMDADGGMSKYPSNQAGAKYGTGYCDAQCPHDIKWISGEANMQGWVPSKTDPSAGSGHFGTCCAELDIWEANKISTQMTVHSCEQPGAVRCEGITCGDNPNHRFDGECDKNGCDFNPYREGAHDFYGPGPGFQLDSTRPMRVVTQFITTDGTDSGDLKEMRRFYIQDNKTIHSPYPSYASGQEYNAISEDMCKAQMTNFTDRYDVFSRVGGVKGMGDAMRRSMALVFSLWDDHDVGMIWLDATDPYPAPPGKAGAQRGTCNQTSGNYSFVEKYHADAYVLFSDVRYGEIGTTYGPGGPPPPPPSCPGGTKDKCVALCDPSDPAKYLACVKSCEEHCPRADDGVKGAVKGTKCVPDETHGCFNGVAYEFSSQFPCGGHDIFAYSEKLCCEQGRSFSTTDEYCCTGSGQNGVHDYSKGKCDMDTPSGCECYDAVEIPAADPPNEDSLIDTSQPPEGGYLCDGTQTSGGCLNGYLFDYAKHAACGYWLVEYGQYGCCPSSVGFLPYQIGSEFCCKNEGAPPGQDYNITRTPCKCHRYGC